ncbi:hypothetical protein [Gluconobacter sphaericus]|uniref:hypothetical protein n=1 Tax=Gluconobacter sphaericus TaxID=574987 RepID=UPI0038CFB045
MGGAPGLGRAVACKAAELDAQVMITCREQDKLTEAQRDFALAGLHVTGCIVDTADVSSITAFFLTGLTSSIISSLWLEASWGRLSQCRL